MKKEQVFRLNGLMAIFVGVVMVIFNSAVAVVQLPVQLISYRTFLSTILLIFVFTGLYAFQVNRAGILGLIGYVVTIISLVLNVCFRFSEIFIGSVLSERYSEAITVIVQGPYSFVQQITFMLFLCGFILFGISTLRAQLLPKLAAWFLMGGGVISYALVMLPINVGAIMSGAAIAWLGYAQYFAMQEQVEVFAGEPITEQ
jgi:hypothetical protein